MSAHETDPMLPFFTAINQTTDHIPHAEARAKQLEEEAARQREAAKWGQVEAFEAAGNQVTELSESGEYSPIEIVTAVARLNDLDPRVRALYGNKDRADRTIAAFQALQLGAPVIGLYDNSRQGRGQVTGIATSDPINLAVHTRTVSRNKIVSQPIMAPWMTFDIPLRTLNKAGDPEEVTIQTELSSLLSREVLVGRAALEALLASVEFRVSDDGVRVCHGGGESNNGISLSMLKDNINTLHTLGMPKVNTKQLNAALGQADRYDKFRRSISRRGLSRSTSLRGQGRHRRW